MSSTAPIVATRTGSPPKWARLQRQLFDMIDAAAIEFADRYSRPDGTLIWRDNWPGMDGSDDPYEGFRNYPLHYALGGSEAVYRRSRILFEGITWQWTQYGQIRDEFDRYYDWMHHGESNLFLYFFGLADPKSLIDQTRSRKFADLYNGRNTTVGNYDPSLKLIRSPITGSDGPRFRQTAEDWSTHREILDNYLPPFEDLPGLDPFAKKCAWSDDATYAAILERTNSRQARGDVPINMIATSMATHAYLYDGDVHQKAWVLDYVAAWRDRAAANGGIIPDNIGLSGTIGEYNDGKWWGGYYGWRWPHGAMTVLEGTLVGASNAYMLSGDPNWLDLPRSQLDMLWNLRQERDGAVVLPARHFDSGWHDFRPNHPMYGTHLWAMTLAEEDAERAERGWYGELFDSVDNNFNQSGDTIGYHMGFNANTAQWFAWQRGRYPAFPEDILELNIAQVERHVAAMRSPEQDPATYDFYKESMSIHRWQDWTPTFDEGLTTLTTGGPMHVYHGGLQFSSVRHFDAELRRPGLPRDVACLVNGLTAQSVRMTFCNVSATAPRHVVVQGGMFGEHRFNSVSADGGPTVELAQPERWLSIKLPPGALIDVDIGITRFCAQPDYATPWISVADIAKVVIRGRDFSESDS